MNQNSDLIAAAIQMTHFNFYNRSHTPSVSESEYETALRTKILENYNWLKSVTIEVSIDEVVTLVGTMK